MASSLSGSPHPYIPATEADRKRMLERIGVADLDSLFTDLPAALRDPEIDLLPALTEPELIALLTERASQNATPSRPNFLGAGGVPTLGAVDRLSPDQPFRVCHGLHPVPARDQPGDVAVRF